MEPTFRISRRELLEKLEFLVPFCRDKKFLGQHCIYHYKGGAFSLSEFSSVIDVSKEGILCVNIEYLSHLLEDVDDYVVCITKIKNKIFLLSEDESIKGSRVRLLLEKEYDADYIKKRESEIESLPKYIELLEKEKNIVL